MKLSPTLALLTTLSLTLSSVVIATPDAMEEDTLKPPIPSTNVIEIKLDAANDGWSDDSDISYEEDTAHSDTNDTHYSTASTETISQDADDTQQDQMVPITDVIESKPLIALPGDDVDFKIKLITSTHHLIQGKVSSDIGKIRFKSRLMPSNEVKLSLTLKQGEIDDIELVAYFDLANFVMELDGGKSVLNKEHKMLMNYTLAHLQHLLEQEYRDYDFPDHALLLAQMLGYWSVSPKGYVHDKRTIVSQQ